MKKLVLIPILFSACLVCAGNLLKDGGFELSRGASGISRAWKYYEFHGAEAVIRLEECTKNAAAGKKSALIRRLSGGSLGGIMQEKVRAVENTAYHIASKVFTGPDSAAFIRIEFINDAGISLGEVNSADKTFAKWGKFDFDFKTPAGTTSLNVIFAMRGVSWVAYDDVSLKPDQKSQSVDWAGFAARCLPVDTVEAWSGKPLFHTFEDSPATLTFQFKGKFETLVKPALVLDLPAGLEMAEAFQQHPGYGTALKPEVTSIKIEGRDYKRYRFVNPPFFKTLMNSWGWRRMMGIAIMPTAKSQTGKEFKAYWHLENKNTVSPSTAFYIRILPALPEKKMPENFYIGFWNGYENDFPSRDVLLKALRKWEKSNFIGTVRLSAIKRNDDLMTKRNWKIATSSFQADQAYQFNKMPSVLKKKVQNRFYSVYRDGKLYKNRMCPTFFLTDKDYTAYAEKDMKIALARTAPEEMVFLDTEPWRPHYFCYCKYCLAEFAKFAKLEKVPTRSEACSAKMYAQWREFRVDQSGKTIAKLVGMVRKTHPKAKIMDYDYPIDYDSQKAVDVFLSRCAKDPRSNEAVIDGHLSSYYHTIDQNMFDLAEVNKRHLKKTYNLILAIDPPGYLAKTSVLSPARFRVMLEGAAALGCSGIWIYSMSVVDGSMAKAAHDAMVKIAEFEAFYRTENQAKTLKVSSDSKNMRYTLHRLNGKTLISIFNYDYNKSIKATLALPAGAVDALSGKALKINNGRGTYTLPPSGSLFILY